MKFPPSFFWLSICLFIGLFVCPEFYTGIVRINFLKIFLNLGFHLTWKVTELNFFLKSLVLRFLRPKGPTWGFSGFMKNPGEFFQIFHMKLQQRSILKLTWMIVSRKVLFEFFGSISTKMGPKSSFSSFMENWPSELIFCIMLW